MKGFRVLVVDDSRAARRVLVAAMTSLGSGTCDEAADGAEALKRFASGEYDLVVTTDRTDAERARALGAGASAFLSKPVGPEDVSRAAATLLSPPS